MALRDAAAVTVRSVTPRVVNWLRPFVSMAAPDAPSAKRSLPIKRIAMQAAGMWLATRLAFLLITVLAQTYRFTHAPTAQTVFPANPQFAPLVAPLLAGHPVLANWVHWDASWYLLIGTHGYDTFTSDSTGFFPLYPLQIYLLTLVFGRQAALPAAMALSNLATLAAFIGLGLLAAHEAAIQKASTEEAATAPARLIKVVAAYPYAFFLAAPFTEGCFLACVVFGLLCARRGWWRWAAVGAVLAGLTRPTAFALIPALAWEYGRQHGLWRRAAWRDSAWRSLQRLRTLAGGLAVSLAMPFGLGCYLFYLQLRYGKPLTPFTAQLVYHGHRNWPVWQTLAELARRFFSPPPWAPSVALMYLDGSLLILFLVIALLNVRRLPVFYTLYLLATLYLLLATPVPHRNELIPSAGRYLLMAVPVFLLFSRWIERRPWLEMLIVGGGFLLQGLFVLFFLNGLWIE